MIITLRKANFANSNIGQLGKIMVLTNFGTGCHYEGPSLIDKNSSFSATVTVDTKYSFDPNEIQITMNGIVLENAFSIQDNIISISIDEVVANIYIIVPTRLNEVQTTMTITVGGQLDRYTTAANIEYIPNASIGANGSTSAMDTYDSYKITLNGTSDDEYYFYIDQEFFRATYIAVVYNGVRYRKSESNLPISMENALTVHGGDVLYITATKERSWFFTVETDCIEPTTKTLPYYTITKNTPGLIKYEGYVLGETIGAIMEANEVFNVYEYTLPNDLNNYYLVADMTCEYLKVVTNDVYMTRMRDVYGTLPTAERPFRVDAGSKIYVAIRKYDSSDFALHILKESAI